MSSIFDWSTTADDNQTADGDINWAEGQNAKTVNNSGRQMMARVREWLNDMGGLGTVGGTANAITLALDSGFTALADGLQCVLHPTSSNTGAVTINVNSIGAKAIRKFDTTGEIALASGDLQDGDFYLLIYDTAANSSAGAWICLNPTPAEYQAASSKLTDIAAITPTDSNFMVGNGTTWVAESGATVRTSLGLGTSAIVNTGTSGAVIPLLNGTNTWANAQTFSGNISVGGTLSATGAATLSSTLAVTGNATFGGTLTTSGNATINGTLTVTG